MRTKVLRVALPVVLALALGGYLRAKTVTEQTCGELFNDLSTDEKVLWTHGYVSALGNVTLASDGYIGELKKSSDDCTQAAIKHVDAFAGLFSYGGSVQELSNEIGKLCKKSPGKTLVDAAFEAWENVSE